VFLLLYTAGQIPVSRYQHESSYAAIARATDLQDHGVHATGRPSGNSSFDGIEVWRTRDVSPTSNNGSSGPTEHW
jgi:hypothetical protein